MLWQHGGNNSCCTLPACRQPCPPLTSYTLPSPLSAAACCILPSLEHARGNSAAVAAAAAAAAAAAGPAGWSCRAAGRTQDRPAVPPHLLLLLLQSCSVAWRVVWGVAGCRRRLGDPQMLWRPASGGLVHVPGRCFLLRHLLHADGGHRTSGHPRSQNPRVLPRVLRRDGC